MSGDVGEGGGEDGGLWGWEGGWRVVFVGVVGAAEVAVARAVGWEGGGDGGLAECGRW